MKKSGILVIAIALVSMSFTNPIEVIKKSLSVDVSNSTINWKGYKPTGSHEGTISLKSGSLELEGNKITGGSFVVDMTTIKDVDGSKKLEGHLKSKDFFEIGVYNTSKFEIISSEIKDGKTLITGNITIKGVSKEIIFPAKIVETAESVTLTSETIHINRTDFNIKYKSKSFFNNLKEKFINDEFDIQVTMVAKK